MKAKQITVIILSLVLLLSVGSGVLLKYQGDQSGGVSSTQEIKYDYVVDNSVAYYKFFDSGARNGSINKLGGASCLEYEMLVDARVNLVNTNAVSEPITLNGQKLTFTLNCPAIIKFSVPNVELFLCYESYYSDPEESEPVRIRLGRSSSFTIEDYPDGYGGEECWLEYNYHATSNVKITIKTLSVLYPSGVTRLLSVSKNLLDIRNSMSQSEQAPYEVVDDKVFMTGEYDNVLYIPVNVPPGTYTFSCSVEGDNAVCWYFDGINYKESDIGDWIYISGSATGIVVCFESSWMYDYTEVVVSNIQLERGDYATEYEPYKEPEVVLDIPIQVQSLPGYGHGNSDMYNYIDFEKGQYVQVCTVEGLELIALDEPRFYDISAWIPPGSGNFDFSSITGIIFSNYYDLKIPSELVYRRVVS